MKHFNSAQNSKNASFFGVSIFGVSIFDCITKPSYRQTKTWRFWQRSLQNFEILKISRIFRKCVNLWRKTVLYYTSSSTWISTSFDSVIYSDLALMIKIGYIDDGDGCWRWSMVVTSFRYWWPIKDVYDRHNTVKKSPIELFCHQHFNSVTIVKLSTSLWPIDVCGRRCSFWYTT